MSDNFEYYPLEWDTEYFGVESAKIELFNSIKDNEVNKIIDLSNNYEFITISNINNNSINNYWIGTKTNAFLTDINIQFSKEISENKNVLLNNIEIENEMSFNSRLLDIASKSFVFSRFLNDPHLPLSKSQDIYLTWTKNSFNQENKYFILYKSNNVVAGYLLFSVNNMEATIELIAVSEKYQGNKIGTKLIQSLEVYSSKNNIKKIKVGTQLNNKGAVQFYSNNNYKYIQTISTYHWWPKK